MERASGGERARSNRGRAKRGEAVRPRRVFLVLCCCS